MRQIVVVETKFTTFLRTECNSGVCRTTLSCLLKCNFSNCLSPSRIVSPQAFEQNLFLIPFLCVANHSFFPALPPLRKEKATKICCLAKRFSYFCHGRRGSDSAFQRFPLGCVVRELLSLPEAGYGKEEEDFLLWEM